jgi:hypothetical protein
VPLGENPQPGLTRRERIERTTDVHGDQQAIALLSDYFAALRALVVLCSFDCARRSRNGLCSSSAPQARASGSRRECNRARAKHVPW